MAPTLTAVVQQQTRVLLTLTWPGIQRAFVERHDPDAAWRPVRSINGDDIQVCLGSTAFFDHEAPLDRALNYRTSVLAGGVYAFDTFTGRVVANGWGTSDSGLAWTISAGTAADFAADGARGTMTHSTASSTHSIVLPLGLVDQDIRVDADTNIGFVSGGDLVSFFDFRMVNTSNYFRLNLRWKQASNTATAELVRVLGGTPSTLVAQTVIPGATNTSGITVRMQATGTVTTGVAVRARAWLTGATEPTTWLVSATDFTIDAPGDLRLGSFRDTGNTNSPTVFRFDTLTVTTPDQIFGPTATATVQSGGQAWLTHPGHPKYAGTATVYAPDNITETRPARRGVFAPIGAELPIVVSDVRGGSTGSITVQTNTAADITRLRAMLADGMPLLLRQPLSWGGDSWWVSIGDTGIDRYTHIATDADRHWVLPYLRVDRPPGATDGAVGQTLDDSKAAYATLNAAKATGKTLTQYAQSIT